jgi:hypothetical protein
MDHGDSPSSCCGPADRCVFHKAMLARTMACAASARQVHGEQTQVVCTAPASRHNCDLLLGMLRERARFALRLGSPAHPLLHAQALRLQCGGLAALRSVVPDGDDDVQALVALARQRHGSLSDLPWPALVACTAAWAPPRRGR